MDVADAWEAALLSGEDPAALRHDGVLPAAAQRMLHAAQGWADRADWDSRGVADGGLGQAMYSRFKEFDAKYMQPLFGADGGGASSTLSSTHLPPGDLLPSVVADDVDDEDARLLGGAAPRGAPAVG